LQDVTSRILLKRSLPTADWHFSLSYTRKPD